MSCRSRTRVVVTRTGLSSSRQRSPCSGDNFKRFKILVACRTSYNLVHNSRTCRTDVAKTRARLVHMSPYVVAFSPCKISFNTLYELHSRCEECCTISSRDFFDMWRVCTIAERECIACLRPSLSTSSLRVCVHVHVCLRERVTTSCDN